MAPARRQSFESEILRGACNPKGAPTVSALSSNLGRADQLDAEAGRLLSDREDRLERGHPASRDQNRERLAGACGTGLVIVFRALSADSML